MFTLDDIITHTLENNDEFYDVFQAYSTMKITHKKYCTWLKDVYKVIRNSNISLTLTANDLELSIFKRDAYIDALAYNYICNYNYRYTNRDNISDDNYKYTPKELIYIIYKFPFIYNIIWFNKTYRQTIQLKRNLLETINTMSSTFKHAQMLNLGDIIDRELELNEACNKACMVNSTSYAMPPCSSLQYFRYFIDCVYKTEFTNKPFKDIVRTLPNDASIIVVHMSYNNDHNDSLFFANDVNLRQDHLTYDEAINNNIFATFDKIYKSDVAWSIHNIKGDKCNISDSNVFMLCYDNNEDITQCVCTVVFYGNNKIFNNKQAYKRLNGYVHGIHIATELNNQFEYKDNEYVQHLPIDKHVLHDKYQSAINEIKHIYARANSYAKFYRLLLENTELPLILSQEDLKFLMIYVKGGANMKYTNLLQYVTAYFGTLHL